MGKAVTWAGVGAILGLMAILFLYQKDVDKDMEVPEPEVQAELADGTLDGYDEEADLVAYMLYQLQDQNLDYGLRGCAVGQLAEYFTMTYYIQYTELYPNLELLPPSEYSSSAYEAIAVSRMSDYYARLLWDGFERFGDYGKLELLNVEEDIPENADGKYYEHMREVEEILGARSVHEVLITVRTDNGFLDMKWTLARYRGGWKVLLFTPLSDYKTMGWNMARTESVESGPVEVSAKESDVLPVNYCFLGANSEEDPEELVRKFLLYLQKEDVWSAMAYYKLYDQKPSADMAYFERQNQAAVEIQNLFYRMFMPDGEMKEWYLRDMDDRAAQLVAELSTAQIVYANFANFEIMESSQEKMKCRIMYGYDNQYEWINFNLIYDNGWKIESIEV